MSNENEELSTMESIKTSSYVFKWLGVIIVMGIMNIIMSKSYGPLKENFFSVDLTNRFLSSRKIMVFFTLSMFAVIYLVREISRKIDFSSRKEENKEETSDFMIYIIISLSTYLYATAYIRRKFNVGSKTLVGGADDGGLFKDTVSKISSTGFGTLTIYVGILVILLNVITNTFQYLKDKKKNQKDKMLRAIYFGQISTMIQFLVACFFIVGFGFSTFQGGESSKIIFACLKWGILIASSILGIHFINKATNGENWFGKTVKNTQGSSNKNNPNLNAVPDQNEE